jgi:glucosamine--fructose-6-phosphate aminotransferase (isomerizing)
MCGIVAYLGDTQGRVLTQLIEPAGGIVGYAHPILINGLRRLEYRGYDSAGVALMNGDVLTIHKCQGKVSDLESHVVGKSLSGSIGIGHTRWATHGPPNDVNAHPHRSTSGDLALIHNGIIENYASIKEELKSSWAHLPSDTDTEVLVHLIDDIQRTKKVTSQRPFALGTGQRGRCVCHRGPG